MLGATPIGQQSVAAPVFPHLKLLSVWAMVKIIIHLASMSNLYSCRIISDMRELPIAERRVLDYWRCCRAEGAGFRGWNWRVFIRSELD